jgi:hypothetical protein
MAIEKLGESLLTNIRERNDQTARQNRKRQRKEDLLAMTGSALIGVGNAYLKEKTQNFLQNKDVYDSIALHKNATKVASSSIEEMETINKSGKGHLEWQMEQMRPFFVARLKENTPDMKEGTDYFNAYVTENLTPLAQKVVDSRTEMLELARGLKDTETFNAETVAKIQRAAPPSVGQFLTSSVANLFTGKSREEIETESLASIVNGKDMQNAERLIEFQAEYNRTKDISKSFNFAKAVVPETPEEERYTTNVSFTVIKGDDGKLVQIEQKTKTDKSTGEIIQGKPSILDVTPATFGAAGVLKTKLSSFNFSKDGATLLNTPAYKKFIREVNDEGIEISDIASTDEYNKVSKIFQATMLEDGALKDSFADSISKSVIQNVLTNSDAVADSIVDASSEDLGEVMERISALGLELRDHISKKSNLSSMPIQSNVHGIDQNSWDSLTSTAKIRIDSMSPEEFARNYK